MRTVAKVEMSHFIACSFWHLVYSTCLCKCILHQCHHDPSSEYWGSWFHLRLDNTWNSSLWNMVILALVNILLNSVSKPRIYEWGTPFFRVGSQTCLLWHLPNNVKQPHGDKLGDVCTACRRLSRDIQQLLQNSSTESKVSRLQVTSNYTLKYLSPDSKSARVARISKESKKTCLQKSYCCPNTL